MKKIILCSFIMTICFKMVTFANCFGDISQIGNCKVVTEYSDDAFLYDMDSIIFGSYPQITTDINIKEPIEWIVLEKDTTYKRALLLSKYILDVHNYNETNRDSKGIINKATNTSYIPWEKCSARKWLNSSFYDLAFNTSEKDKILSTSIANEDDESNTNKAIDTLNKLFYLSVDECYQYFGYEEVITSNKKLATKMTNYARNIDVGGKETIKKLYNSDWYTENSDFLLRSHGKYNDSTSRVLYDGFVDTAGVDNNSSMGVRPALWVSYGDVYTYKNDVDFKNRLHILTNDLTNTSTIVRDDGKIIIKEMDLNAEEVHLVENINGYEYANFAYKRFPTNFVKNHYLSKEEKKQKGYSDKEIEMKYYDSDGNEIVWDFYDIDNTSSKSIEYSTDELIICREGNQLYEKGGYYAYNINTAHKIYIPYPFVYVYNKKFVFANESILFDSMKIFDMKYKGISQWDKDAEIAVFDEKLNAIKRIDGYSICDILNFKEFNFVRVFKKYAEPKPMLKYNLLDENFEFVFDEDVDEVFNMDKYPLITIKKDDKTYDYNLQTKEISNNNDKEIKQSTVDLRNKYKSIIDKIHYTNYYSVDPFEYDDKILFLAFTDSYDYDYDYDYDTLSCDVYNSNCEKILEIKNLNHSWYESGYLFVDNNTVYDIDLNIVKKFDSYTDLKQHKKFDTVFFTDNEPENNADFVKNKYNNKTYTLYDKNFNVISKNVRSINFNTDPNYIILSNDEGTIFIDEHMIKTKKFDRRFSIQSFNETKNMSFFDLDRRKMGVMDEKYNIFIDNLKSVTNLKNNYFTYRNGFKYGFMDYKGKALFSFSIFDTMSED